MVEIPKQHLKRSIKAVATKFNVSERTAKRYLSEVGASKSREQYKADALERRRIVYELRQSGLKWREIGEKLGISTANAQMLGQRYKKALKASKSD